jgi:RNA ligase (TIGR02306 family)
MMEENKGLVYIGKIIAIDAIPNADQIVSATVVCGHGGKWKGVVRKAELGLLDLCEVYLPDALVPEDDMRLQFLKNSNWRVKMRRFRGAPSEVVIMPLIDPWTEFWVGFDLTEFKGVTKYTKPVPVHLQGLAKGNFPAFIPKTDELNYQRHGDLVDQLVGMPYYITEKADGSSTTAYRYKGEFGLCSRNLELEYNPSNGYWQVCKKYNVEEKLPEGFALQWETCGPGIQGNPMGLTEIEGFAFSGYNIAEHKYLSKYQLEKLCNDLQFPMCPVLAEGDAFSSQGIEVLGEGKYSNANEREGVVVRSQDNVGTMPISFKVINLGYEK